MVGRQALPFGKVTFEGRPVKLQEGNVFFFSIPIVGDFKCRFLPHVKLVISLGVRFLIHTVRIKQEGWFGIPSSFGKQGHQHGVYSVE